MIDATFAGIEPPASPVAICGAAESGKDTLAGLLVSCAGYYRRALADEIKERAGALLFGGAVNASDPTQRAYFLRWVEAKKHLPAMRTILQTIGNEGRELMGEEVWVKALISHLCAVHALPYPGLFDNGTEPIFRGLRIVVPDMRYHNEGETLRRLGFTLIRVERPGHQNRLTPAQREHVTETAHLDIPVDFVLTNDSTPLDLYRRFCRAMANHIGALALPA